MRRRVVNTKTTQVEVDLEKLTRIQRALGARFAARVGILGKTTGRQLTGALAAGGGHKVIKKSKAPMTNAYIGLVHERGSLSLHIPRRSFLEDTFFLKGKRLLQIKGRLWKWFSSGEHTPARLKQIYAALGHHGEALVQQAFETGGFGKWPPLSPITIARKKSSAKLIDTAQLRRAITSDVVTS